MIRTISAKFQLSHPPKGRQIEVEQIQIGDFLGIKRNLSWSGAWSGPRDLFWNFSPATQWRI